MIKIKQQIQKIIGNKKKLSINYQSAKRQYLRKINFSYFQILNKLFLF